MSLFFQQNTTLSFDEVLRVVNDELLSEGFQMITDLEIQNKLKEQLGDKYMRYVVFAAQTGRFQSTVTPADGGFNPPRNVIVQESGDSNVEILAFDPTLSVQSQSSTEAPSRTEQIKDRLESALRACM